MKKQTIAVIVGNRDFFPDSLVAGARDDIRRVFRKVGLEPLMLEENNTRSGAIETYADAQKCATFFRENSDEISGVLVTLPNFGDEKAVADTLKLARLDVPVLVHAYPDDLHGLGPERRRDAFCGKISVCNNLDQAHIPFSLTNSHVVNPRDDRFLDDLEWFAGVCRVVRGMRSARVGAIGARPGAFNTVRYSEKILEANGISVTTVDLSEILFNARDLAVTDIRVKEKADEIRAYANAKAVPRDKLNLMAKLGVVLDKWTADNGVDVAALQCWTSIQQNYGISPCAVMSMMSQSHLPTACEVDVTGALSMYALQLASGKPSALADWNNNYEDDEEKCVLFHCGNWPKCLLPDAKIGVAPILGSILGEENTCGALAGRAPEGPLTYARLTTDDGEGVIRAYLGEGHLTDDPLSTFGASAVAQIPGLQELLRFICSNGFEHHVAINGSHCADILAEAFENYLKWEMYFHEGDDAAPIEF